MEYFLDRLREETPILNRLVPFDETPVPRSWLINQVLINFLLDAAQYPSLNEAWWAQGCE